MPGRLAADSASWTFVTGPPETMERFGARLGLSVMRSDKDPVDITHNLRTAVVRADGTLVKVIGGNAWTPAEDSWPSSRRSPSDPMSAPPLTAFTAPERRLVDRLRTPASVQRWLNGLPYNDEPDGETLRSFRAVARHGTAHCLEAALAAAVLLEQHGLPPLVLSFESIDQLDHVIFVYQRPSPSAT